MAFDSLLTEVASYRSGFPHELFERLRHEGAVHYQPPVQFRQDEPATDFWSVVRHTEVQRANRDWETFSSNDSVSIYKFPAQAGTTIVSMDPPQHTRVRRLISAGFTPRMIKRLIDAIGVRTRLILDEAASMGECDFVRDIAYQLPMHVIADIVGIPEPDRRWVFERTELISRSLDPNSALTMEDHNRNQLELFAYALELTARKRRDPSDDVWTLIAQAEIPSEDGTMQSLQGIELELLFAVLAVAGSETPRNAISIGLLTLLENADQMSELRQQPELMAERLTRSFGGRALSCSLLVRLRAIPNWAGSGFEVVTVWSCGAPRLTGMNGNSRIHSGSTSIAAQITMCRSVGAALITASGQTWLVGKSRS